MLEGKQTDVYYILKDGARPNVYDITAYADNAVVDTTNLAEVYSSDDSDMEEAATLKMKAASELMISKSRNIKALQLDALAAISGAFTPGVKVEKEEEETDDDEAA